MGVLAVVLHDHSVVDDPFPVCDVFLMIASGFGGGIETEMRRGRGAEAERQAESRRAERQAEKQAEIQAETHVFKSREFLPFLAP